MAEQDQGEIIQVLNLYGFVLDGQLWDLFDRVFVEDVVAEFGPAGMVWRDLNGLKEHFIEFHQELDNHQHTMMGQVVHVDGDRAYAFSYGNWLLRREAAEGDPTWIGTGWYDDELIRTDAGWRICHRIARLVSWSGNPAVVGHNPDADFNLFVLRREIEAGKVGFYEAIAGK
jgi:hypothetical protein